MTKKHSAIPNEVVVSAIEQKFKQRMKRGEAFGILDMNSRLLGAFMIDPASGGVLAINDYAEQMFAKAHKMSPFITDEVFNKILSEVEERPIEWATQFMPVDNPANLWTETQEVVTGLLAYTADELMLVEAKYKVKTKHLYSAVEVVTSMQVEIGDVSDMGTEEHTTDICKCCPDFLVCQLKKCLSR